MRNLHDNPVGGRPLRVDLAPDDPKQSKQKERERERDRYSGGGGGVGGVGSVGGGSGVASTPQYAPLPPPHAAANMGVDIPPTQSATDSISQTLASLPPNQLLDVMAQMKASVHTKSNTVRQLLVQNPQLSYALFQAMLMMNLVDNHVVQVCRGVLKSLSTHKRIRDSCRQLLRHYSLRWCLLHRWLRLCTNSSNSSNRLCIGLRLLLTPRPTLNHRLMHSLQLLTQYRQRFRPCLKNSRLW